jgi:hypothetical protein
MFPSKVEKKITNYDELDIKAIRRVRTCSKGKPDVSPELVL